MSDLMRKLGALPRAARWGLAFVVLLALYFVAIEPAIEWRNRISAGADRDAAMLSRFEAADDTVKRARDTVLTGQFHFGEVEYPGDPETRPLAFNRAVDEVLRKHGVSGQTSTTRTVAMGSGPLTSRVGATHRVERLTRQIEFQAAPEAAAGVIADLEQSPLVATISNVQVRQLDARDKAERAVTTSLTVEAWLLSKKGKTK